MLKEGDAAPDFELLDDQSKTVRLKDFSGQPLVVYFYPKADTPGCTREACAFRDTITEFKKLNVPVLGVSPDKPSSQLKFKNKYDLPFSLLCDTERKMAKAYGVISEKSLYGRLFMGVDRTTFVIDPAGKIKKIFHKVKVDGHADEVLAALKQ